MTTFTLRPSTGEGTRLTSLRSSALSMAKAAAEVDVVVDYLWGEPATIAIMALLEARADRSRAMDWVQIGAMAGPRSSFRRWRYAPPTSGSRAMGKGRYPPRHVWRSSPLSSTRSMLEG